MNESLSHTNNVRSQKDSEEHLHVLLGKPDIERLKSGQTVTFSFICRKKLKVDVSYLPSALSDEEET